VKIPPAALLSWVVVAACARSPDAGELAAQPLTPTQQQALDALVARIEQATRESFEKNDWSILASLYPPGTFACWTEEFTDGPYSFLSRAGIPDDAHYTWGPIARYHFAPSQDDSKMQATHFVVIRYERAYLARCGNPAARIYPQEHFFVRAVGDRFQLVHYCPGDPSQLPAGFSPKWPMVSAGHAREVVDAMTPPERTRFRRQLLAEPIPLRAILDFGTRHGLTEEQTYFAIDRICALTSPSTRP